MRKYLKFLGIACVVCLMSFSFLGDDWKLRKSEDGIKVYTSSVVGSEFKKCKATAQISCDIDKLATWIGNPVNFKKLNKKIQKINIIKKTASAVVYYMGVDVPWPVSNRDGVYMLTTKKTGKDLIDINIKAMPNLLKEQNGYIRVKKADTHYRLKRTADNKVDLVYQSFTDPNGKIPAWLSNAYLVDGPLNNLKYFKKNIGY